jgi:MFS family permease
MLGPALGAVAHVVGEGPAFGAVALVSCTLAAVALRLPAPGRQSADFGSLALAATRRDVFGGFWIVMLASLLFGLVAVLVPLELDRLGWGAVAIGALWLAAAGIEAAMNPFLGRLVDRRGRIFPVRITLAGAVAVSVAFAWADTAAVLALLVLLAAVAFGGLFTPGLSLVSDGAEEAGVAQALAFGAMNAAWAAGNLVGPAAGGALARAAGDTTAFLVAAAVCALTLAAVVRSAAAAAAPAYPG